MMMVMVVMMMMFILIVVMVMVMMMMVVVMMVVVVVVVIMLMTSTIMMMMMMLVTVPVVVIIIIIIIIIIKRMKGRILRGKHTRDNSRKRITHLVVIPWLLFHQSIHPSVNDASIHPPSHTSIHPSIHPSIHLSIHPPTQVVDFSTSSLFHLSTQRLDDHVDGRADRLKIKKKEGEKPDDPFKAISIRGHAHLHRVATVCRDRNYHRSQMRSVAEASTGKREVERWMVDV